LEPAPEIFEQVPEQEVQPAAAVAEEEEDPEMPELVAQDPADAESDGKAEEEEKERPAKRNARIAGGIL
jgi:hypothetical protein